eukprot:g15034.t1
MSASSLTKKELVELLECAKNAKEQNKAVKLLKRFDPVPNLDCDELYNCKENFSLKEFQYVIAFLCFRCGKVKQCKTKIFWQVPKEGGGVEGNTSGKMKRAVICTACYGQLKDQAETTRLRAAHQKQGLVPKGHGFGMFDHTMKLP